MADIASPAQESWFDRPLVFTLPDHNARGRLVRLGPVLNLILSAHGYPPVIERLLSDALVLSALLGSTLKNDDGQFTLQAQTQAGAVDLLVCDYRAGELRGHVKFDAEAVARLGDAPTLGDLFGQGYLAITFDQPSSDERYQGIVPLEGKTIAEAAQTYFAQSDQLPSLVRIAGGHDAGGNAVGAGMLLQYLPDGEAGRERLDVRDDTHDWDHVRALAETLSAAEMTDTALSLETLAWRLFHEEEIRVLPGQLLTRGCRCDPDYIRTVIARFPEADRADMADANGDIIVDCAFCSRGFKVETDSVE